MLETSEGRLEAVHHQAAWTWRDLTRFRTQNFAAAIFFENFGPILAPNRTKSHAPQHADARYTCWGPLKVVGKLCTIRRHGIWRDLTRFRTQNFAAAKISVRNRLQIARNLTRHSMLTLATDVGDLYECWESYARLGGMDFGAISRDFERKIF